MKSFVYALLAILALGSFGCSKPADNSGTAAPASGEKMKETKPADSGGEATEPAKEPAGGADSR